MNSLIRFLYSFPRNFKSFVLNLLANIGITFGIIFYLLVYLPVKFLIRSIPYIISLLLLILFAAMLLSFIENEFLAITFVLLFAPLFFFIPDMFEW